MGTGRATRGALIAFSLLTLVASAAENPSKGWLLIAAASSTDPDLARSVVLLLRSDAQGAVGLILNQPTSVPVSTVFPHVLNEGSKTMAVFKGGPLRMGVNGLIREKQAVIGRSLVFGDVYLVSRKQDLETLLSKQQKSPVRVYVGLCGWSAGQLADEIRRGTWRVHGPDAGIVFDEQPESVWERLAVRRAAAK